MQRTQLRLSTCNSVIITQSQSLSWATSNNVVDDVLTTFRLQVVLELSLVNLHIIAPCTDYSKVSTFDSILTVVRTTRNLELELVRQCRTMNIISEVVYQPALNAACSLALDISQRAAPTQDIAVRTHGPAPPRSQPNSLISSKNV